MPRPPKPKDELLNVPLEILVTEKFANEFAAYTTGQLRRGVSPVGRELLERELRTKSLSPHADWPVPSTDLTRLDRGEEEPIMQGQESIHGQHRETAEYGRVAVFESADKTLCFGVAVYPYRHSANLLVVDLNIKQGEFARLDLAGGIAAELDEVLELAAYSWETPQYRDICQRLGLNPDHRRPSYREKYRDLAARLVAEIDQDCATDWISLGRKNFWYDFLDLVRADQEPDTGILERVKRDALDYQETAFSDELEAALKQISAGPLAQSPLTLAVVNFLPSAFGIGFNASLYSGKGKDCDPDGWPTALYRDLGGIALDFTATTQWQKTVRRHLLEQGVILLSRQDAEYYMQAEGAYWLWSSGATTSMVSGIEARQPSRWEAIAWRLRKPSTSLSDAAYMSFFAARRRNAHQDAAE